MEHLEHNKNLKSYVFQLKSQVFLKTFKIEGFGTPGTQLESEIPGVLENF